jgi:hypothetical protein
MKLRFVCVLQFSLLLLTNSAIKAQIEIINDISMLPSHPRIFLFKGEETGILQTIASDKTWGNMHESILVECVKILDQPPVEKKLVNNKQMLAVSQLCLHRIIHLSYAWRITKDEKYLKRAEKELLAVSAFDDWNPKHFLDVGEMTMAAGIGYDWLYNDLPRSSLDIIKKAIIEKGLKSSLRPEHTGWSKGTSNWNQVCNAGVTIGALAVLEEDPEIAYQVINRAITSILLPMGDYEPDGAYPEGFGYWGFGTLHNVLLISALEKTFGKQFDFSKSQGFIKTAEYYQNMTAPSGLCFNYSDCGEGSSINAAMVWFAKRLNDPTLLWSEKRFLGEDKPFKNTYLPIILIWSSGLNKKNITAPSKTVWVGHGKNPVALMRTSWTDPNAIFVGLKCGSPSNAHSHLDVGSFVFESNGVRWAMDLGSEDYAKVEEVIGNEFWRLDQNSPFFALHNLEADILPVISEFLPGISETNNQLQ